MNHEVDTGKLAAALRQKRDSLNLGLRGAAEIISEDVGEVSASTLSRVEQGKLPDLDTFFKLCRWLGVAPSYFATDPDAVGKLPEMPENIIVHLRADRTLPERTVEALITMIQTAYAAAKQGDIHDEAKDV